MGRRLVRRAPDGASGPGGHRTNEPASGAGTGLCIVLGLAWPLAWTWLAWWVRAAPCPALWSVSMGALFACVPAVLAAALVPARWWWIVAVVVSVPPWLGAAGFLLLCLMWSVVEYGEPPAWELEHGWALLGMVAGQALGAGATLYRLPSRPRWVRPSATLAPCALVAGIVLVSWFMGLSVGAMRAAVLPAVGRWVSEELAAYPPPTHWTLTREAWTAGSLASPGLRVWLGTAGFHRGRRPRSLDGVTIPGLHVSIPVSEPNALPAWNVTSPFPPPRTRFAQAMESGAVQETLTRIGVRPRLAARFHRGKVGISDTYVADMDGIRFWLVYPPDYSMGFVRHVGATVVYDVTIRAEGTYRRESDAGPSGAAPRR